MSRSTFSQTQSKPLAMPGTTRARGHAARAAALLATLVLAACGVWIHDDIPEGDLKGIVTIEWDQQDNFIYRPDPKRSLSFQPYAWRGTDKRITPTLMYTDGGSIPRFFWNVPGLSPWGFGPAYVIHDYIFAVHRCRWPDPVVSQITFEDSAEILAEIGAALIRANLIRNDALNAIVWGVRTRYARDLWETPGDPVRDCSIPKLVKGLRTVQVVHFEIPPTGARLPLAPGDLR
jgi:hypothetical protein